MFIATETKMTISVPADLLKEMKKRAIDKNITLKIWVLQAVLEKIAQEDKAK